MKQDVISMQPSNCCDVVLSSSFDIEHWFQYYNELYWYKLKPIFISLQKYLNYERIAEKIGEMYLGGKKTIISCDLFIVTNIRIYCQMDSA